MKWLQKTSSIASEYFALWVLLASAIGLLWPSTFLFLLPHIRIVLGVIMFGMGMTLSPDDFRRVATRPGAVGAGVAAQFAVMPLLAFGIARLLELPPEIAVGFILLGACPGGTASNVIAYLARGDVALSVTMTSFSTVLSPLLTPVLTLWLAGQWMPIPVAALFLSIVQIVLVPVVLGVVARRFFSKAVAKATSVMPLVSVTAIVTIVGAIVGKNVEQILSIGPLIFLGVVAHNGLGLLLGFGVGSTFRFGEAQRRALAIEVGMQNSGLAVALAASLISPAAALPAALFSVWHNVTGPLLATIWVRRDGVALRRRVRGRAPPPVG
jgi:BASS family bile acid:Na+ symporter